MMVSQTSFGILKLLLLIPGVAYLGLVVFAATFANRLVFPAPAASYKDSPDIIKFPYDDKGRSVSMIFLQNPGSDQLIFYHHGNGEDLQHTLGKMQFLREAGYSVLAWDYPGYGTSDGRPTEKLVLEIAEKIWNRIPADYGYAHDQVVHYGYSLGGGPAIWLAKKYACAGVIVEGTFTSIFRVGLPIKLLPWDLFDNQRWIPDITCPILIMHGTEDETVPFSHAKKLYELAPDPKSFTWVHNGRHTDLLDSHQETYLDSLKRFTESL
ncbi:MAG: alpha/beta hydrolase [Puniceicoccaceae bacterium]